MPTRLALTVLAAGFGMLWSANGHAGEEPATFDVFIGTYTNGSDSQGIYYARFNPSTGALSVPEARAKLDNPSFLAISPKGDFLYAVAEVTDFDGKSAGGVYSFAIDPATCELKPLNHQSSGGAAPCHCVVDHSGLCVLVANYGGGSVACFPLNADGSLKPASTFIQHAGTGPNSSRQEAPHAHSINVSPDNSFAIVADLGMDKVLTYQFDAERGTLAPNDPPSTSMAAGAGPRHFAFHPNGNFGYVINELALTVTALRYAPQTGVLYGIQSISTVPDGVDRAGLSTADIHVHPSGRYVYGSNRGHDSIAMFKVDESTGTLTSLGQQPTGGKTPRNFSIDPTGQFLLAANQDSHTIVVFRINQETGVLEPTNAEVSVPMPVCIQFLPGGSRAAGE